MPAGATTGTATGNLAAFLQALEKQATNAGRPSNDSWRALRRLISPAFMAACRRGRAQRPNESTGSGHSETLFAAHYLKWRSSPKGKAALVKDQTPDGKRHHSGRLAANRPRRLHDAGIAPAKLA